MGVSSGLVPAGVADCGELAAPEGDDVAPRGSSTVQAVNTSTLTAHTQATCFTSHRPDGAKALSAGGSPTNRSRQEPPDGRTCGSCCLNGAPRVSGACACVEQLSHGCRFTPTVEVPCPSVKGSVSQGEGPTHGAGSVNIGRLATDDAPNIRICRGVRGEPPASGPEQDHLQWPLSAQSCRQPAIGLQ